MEIIDLSNVNGKPINFPQIYRAGIRGVWLKATEGKTFDDPMFAQARNAARKAGLRVGAYHFARPDNNNPESEAEHFIRVVGKLGRRDLKPVLDMEHGTGNHFMEDWSRRFNQRVKKEWGVIPIFYSYPYYIEQIAPRTPIGNGLWIASYGSNDGKIHPVAVPNPWKNFVAHQYTSNGKIPGVPGNVDRSYAPKTTGVLAFPIRGLL